MNHEVALSTACSEGPYLSVLEALSLSLSFLHLLAPSSCAMARCHLLANDSMLGPQIGASSCLPDASTLTDVPKLSSALPHPNVLHLHSSPAPTNSILLPLSQNHSHSKRLSSYTHIQCVRKHCWFYFQNRSRV